MLSIQEDTTINAMGNRFEITLESTMIGPLYARAHFGEMFPEILLDSEAASLMERVKELHPDAEREFLAMESMVSEFLGLTLLIRARNLDDAIQRYTSMKPDATVVNPGCGLRSLNTD
jgi:O-methyltransferase involved in polyketide biosynthesis